MDKWKKRIILMRKCKNWFKSTVGKSVTIGVLVIMCLALGTMGYYSVQLANTSIQSEMDAYNAEVNMWVTEQKCILQMFVNSIRAQGDMYKDYDRTVDYLDEITQNYTHISASYLSAENMPQKLIINSGWLPGEDYDLTLRDWYINAVDTDDIIITGPYIDLQSGEYCLSFSKRVEIDGVFAGVFGIDFYIDELTNILSGSYEGDEYAFLVNEEGLIVTHPSKDYQLSNLVQRNVSETSYYREEMRESGVIFDYDKRLKCVMATHTEDSPFSVYIVKDWFEAYRVLIISVFMYIFVIAVAFWGINESDDVARD